MSRRFASQPLPPGSIAYFMYLHLNTARWVRRAEKKGHDVYDVEAKARPVLVLDEQVIYEHGAKWYRVLRVTSTKPIDSRGKLRRGYEFFGPYVDPEKVSYIFCYPEWYPENLVYPDGGPTKQLDRMVYDNLIKVITAKALRR
ncbi:MAG: hypothetical protein KY475_06290 [Planctomycetes bacterium]|nr:hypothetical protein [Planctomycetota bacterium]